MFYLVAFILVLGLGPVALYVHTDAMFYVGATLIAIFDVVLILFALGSHRVTENMIIIAQAKYATVLKARKVWKVHSALYVIIALAMFTWPAFLYIKGIEDFGIVAVGFVSLALSIAPMIVLYLRLLKISR